MQPEITNAFHPLTPLLQKPHNSRNLLPLIATIEFNVQFTRHSLYFGGSYIPLSVMATPFPSLG